jgi:hypothetical protein
LARALRLHRPSQFVHPHKTVVPARWDRQAQYHVDDVLTRFVERADLISRLKAAVSFMDFVRVWEWLGTES